MATIKDVASQAGVAVSTVSRVINGHPDVSEDTRKRVLSAVSELHYVPNNSARDLVCRQPDAIGLVVRGAENPFFSPVINAIEHACEEAGYSVILRQIKSDEDEVAEGAALVQAKRLKGLILLGGRFDYTLKEGSSITAPFVCCTYTDEFGNLDATSYSSISIDDYREAYRATKILIDRGHTKIAVLADSTTDHSISQLRYRGYCDALKDADIELDEGLVLVAGEYSMEAAFEKTTELLANRRDFTAIFCIADTLAIAAMKALHNADVKIPEECSVIAIDGIRFSHYVVPTLTTLVQPAEELGAGAVQILVNVIEGREKNSHVRVQTTLRQGGTVASPRSSATMAPAMALAN